jgi:hypothetical protein
MNQRGMERIERGVQVAVIRAPTTSLLEAVAEARRRQVAAGSHTLERSQGRLMVAAA